MVGDSKVYKVTDIDFWNLTIEADETDLSIADVPENEIFPIGGFSEFKIKLHNGGGMGEIVDFVEWVKQNRRAE